MAPPSALCAVLVLTAASLPLVALGANTNPSTQAKKGAAAARVVGTRQQSNSEDYFTPSPGFEVVTVQDDGQSGGALSEDIKDCTCVDYYLCDENQNINQDGQGVIDIRQQAGKCEHYLQYCCKFANSSSTPTPTPTPDPYPINPDPTPDPAPTPRPRPQPRPDVHPTPPPQDNYCGQRNPAGVGFRITGDKGGEAQFGEFPWMTAILQEEIVEQGEQGRTKTINQYQCGGSLITPLVVLTAAHCVNNKDPRRLKIRAGEWDTQTTREKYIHQDRGVAQVVVHPSFRPGNLHNDIALLILQDPVQIGGHIGLVCLPEQDQSFDFERECYATGWGKDKFAQDGQYQVIMKKIELPIVPNPQCEELLRKTRLGAYFLLDASFICAGGEVGKDTCKGDGGSPLVCPIQGQQYRYYQAGVVSWGIDCALDSIPGVYGSVSRFRKWIDNELQRLQIDITGYQA